MQADGTTMQFSTRAPTDEELRECPHVIMTSRAEWNPRSVIFPDHTGDCEDEDDQKPPMSVSAVQREMLFATEDELQIKPTVVAARLIAEIRVENPLEVSDDVPIRRTFVSKERHPRVTPEGLSEIWGIANQQMPQIPSE